MPCIFGLLPRTDFHEVTKAFFEPFRPNATPKKFVCFPHFSPLFPFRPAHVPHSPTQVALLTFKTHKIAPEMV